MISMVAASAACWAGVAAVAGGASLLPVSLGVPGPLAAALATWVLVARTQARDPGRVAGLMIRLFAAKLILFGAYVAAVVLSLSAGHRAFAASFACQYIVLHAIEAGFLHRLFAGVPSRPGVG